MKTLIPLTAIAALAASGLTYAQSSTAAFSTPSGYVTQNLSQGFNLIGINLVSPSQASGQITALNSSSISDSSRNFDSLFNAGQVLLLEITSGARIGQVVEASVVVESPTSNVTNLSTADNLASIGVVVGDTYRVSAAPTLEQIFGTTESVLTRSNNSNNADIVWVPDGAGGFNRYFLNNASAWRNAAGGAASNIPIVFLDGLFVEKELPGTVSLTFTGQVRVNATRIGLRTGFNPVGTVFPAGATLQNSGMVNSLLRSNNSNNADLVWIPTGVGTYDRFFVNNSGAWRNAAGGAAPLDHPLTSGVFIETRVPATGSPTTEVILTPPASYSDL